MPHQHAFIDLHRSGDDDDDDNGKLIIIVKEICMSFNYHEHYTLYKIRVCTKACNVEKKTRRKTYKLTLISNTSEIVRFFFF